MSFLAHLECAACGLRQDPDQLWNLCPACGKPLLARYLLAAAARALAPADLRGRPAGVWRFAELLPVRDPARRLTLGEGGTPLLAAPRLAAAIGLPAGAQLWIKEEGLNPTASFKARGMAGAIARAGELGAREFSIPSAGNAAGAACAYAAAAGATAHVFLPRDVSPIVRAECAALGGMISLVDGAIGDCARAAAAAARPGWFDLATLREPYRIEGKKTMGYELAEQLGWELPEWVVYPTGGGTGLIGMWKAFAELEALGWIGPDRPRMVSVQAAGCAPIVRAFAEGAREAATWADPRTVAEGLRVPSAIGDFLILGILRESGGTAVAVSEEAIRRMGRAMAASSGILPAPETAAALAGLANLAAGGQLSPGDRVVLFSTASGLKYPPYLA